MALIETAFAIETLESRTTQIEFRKLKALNEIDFDNWLSHSFATLSLFLLLIDCLLPKTQSRNVGVYFRIGFVSPGINFGEQSPNSLTSSAFTICNRNELRHTTSARNPMHAFHLLAKVFAKLKKENKIEIKKLYKILNCNKKQNYKKNWIVIKKIVINLVFFITILFHFFNFAKKKNYILIKKNKF